MLFRGGDRSYQRVYLVILGRLSVKGLVNDEYNTYGQILAGDSCGEEGIYEVYSQRKDTVVAERQTFMLEFEKDKMIEMREKMQQVGDDLALDWFTFNNHMKKQWVKKRTMRQLKKSASEMKLY